MTCCHVSAVLHQLIDLLGARSVTSTKCRLVAPGGLVSKSMAADAITPVQHIFGWAHPKRRRPVSSDFDTRAKSDANLAASTKRLENIYNRLHSIRSLRGNRTNPLALHFPFGVKSIERRLIQLPDPGKEDKEKILDLIRVRVSVEDKLQKVLESRLSATYSRIFQKK